MLAMGGVEEARKELFVSRFPLLILMRDFGLRDR